MTTGRVTARLRALFLGSGLKGADKAVYAPLALAAAFFIAAIVLYPFERAASMEAGAAMKREAEFTVLVAEYGRLKARPGPSGGGAGAGGAVAAIEAEASSMGLKHKIKSIKSAGERTLPGGGRLERAEARFERLTLNELVNLLHAVEGAWPLRSVTVRKSFDSPELLDLAVTVEVAAGAK